MPDLNDLLKTRLQYIDIVYLAFVQYESSQTDQSDLTGNHYHILLQRLWQSKALRLAGCAGVRGHSRAGGGEVRGGRARHVDVDWVLKTNVY